MNPLPPAASGPTSFRSAPADAQGLLDAARQAAARGDYEDAVARCRRALALAESSGLRDIEAAALGALAEAESRLGDGEGAIAHAHRALMLQTGSRDAGERARNLCTLVLAYLCVGLPADALTCATAAIAAARADGDPSLVSWALNRAGSTHRALGEAGRGVQLLEDALRLARKFDLVEEQASACNNLCGALLTLSAAQSGAARDATLARALAAGEQGLALTERAANVYGIAMCHGVLAGANLAAGHLDTALAHARRSRELAERHGYRLAALTARIVSASLERERGNLDLSIALYDGVLRDTRGTDDHDWALAAHQGLHESWKLKGEAAAALEHLEALRYFDRLLQEQRAQRQVRVQLNAARPCPT
jgi:tetratricopeptide (TPR) repeat protein